MPTTTLPFGAKPACATPDGRKALDAANAAKGPHGYKTRDAFAEAYCAQCPVRLACLDIALTNGEHALWGGLSERQRRAIQPHAYTHNLTGVHKAAS